MAVKRIEALADGIAFINNMHDPKSDAYQLRNPALARAYSYRHLGEVDNKGRRIFSSLIGGYRFLIQDLEWKCSGQTRAKGYNGRLNPMNTLQDLLKSYGHPVEDGSIFLLIDFLSNALPGLDINAQTVLKFFVAEGN
jgi:hypothetical protein